MSEPIYIGITGLARTGKNLFCDIATKILHDKYKLQASTYALAYELKCDCDHFIYDKLNLNVFSEITEEKNVFRPLLVWYAGVKRKQTNGRYWLELLEKRIKRENTNVIFISDLRYCEYAKDEVYWLKNELKGKLVHVSKYTYGFPTDGRHIKVVNDKTKKIYTEPPNIDESINDPKMKKYADYCMEWEDVGGKNLINNEYLNEQVEKCLSSILPSDRKY